MRQRVMDNWPVRHGALQRCFRAWTHPAFERGDGLLATCDELVPSRVNHCSLLARRHRFHRTALAPGNACTHRRIEQAVLAIQRIDERELVFDRIARNPGKRRFPQHSETGDAGLCFAQCNPPTCNFNACAALGGVRKFLHDADALHGHRFTGQAETVGALDGYVIEPQGQLGIGQLASWNGRLPGSVDLR